MPDEVVTDEKCGDMGMAMPMMDMEPPFGGATSFAEMDAWSTNQAMAEYIDEVADRFKTLMNNIMSNDSFGPAQKATAAAALTKEFQQRIVNPDTDELDEEKWEVLEEDEDEDDDEKSLKPSWWQKILGRKDYNTAQRRAMAKRGEAKPDLSFPIANVADLHRAISDWGRAGSNPSDKAWIVKRARALNATDQLPANWEGSSKKKSLEDENTVTLPANRGFKVYRDLEGDLRWLSLSSNAFEDLDKELFTTKALEEAIEHADKTGERGPLLIYHVPSAEIGQCDYQAMAGRFLVESGTFDDTPLGRKAVEYFTNSDEEHQVSIGYEYHLGDEEDGIYEWTRIKERSVCPYGAAANPWTDFKVIGDNPMDARKAATLEKIFGKELAAGVISSAEERTKELEGTTKFKENKSEETVTLDELNAAAEAAVTAILDSGKAMPSQAEIDKMPDGPAKAAMQKRMAAMDSKKEVSTEPKTEQEPAPTFSGEQVTQLATLITDLTAQVEELTNLSETVKELQIQVKELSKSTDEKVSDVIAPRWQLPNNGLRPSESDKNVITDPKAIKELQNPDEGYKDPATDYVMDLLGKTAVASN